MAIIVDNIDLVRGLSQAFERLGTSERAHKVLSDAVGSLFKDFGLRVAGSMKSAFSAFTGEVQSSIQTNGVTGNIFEASGSVLLMEVGIPAGTVSRDHGYYQDKGRGAGYGVPIDDPYFLKWIQAKFSPKDSKELRRIAINVSRKIKLRGLPGKDALAKSLRDNLSEYDSIVNRFGDVLIQRLYNEFDTAGVY